MSECNYDALLTRAELAKRLNLTVRGIDALVKRRLLTCIRLGRKCVRFRWNEIQRDLERMKILSVGEDHRQKPRQRSRPLVNFRS